MKKILYSIVVLLVLGAVGYLIGSDTKESRGVEEVGPVEKIQGEELQKDFEVVVGKTYVVAKQELLSKGWIAYEPTSDDSALSEPWVSAGDVQFPEIGWCGQGLDAICNVNFKKGELKNHINVKVGGRAPSGPYTEWTVVGGE